MKRYRLRHLWQPTGWLADALLEVDDEGRVAGLSAGGVEEAELVPGYALPGMPNLHSHAFQRAMAGLAEHAGGGQDSFWTWRAEMYRFVERLGPEEVSAIAAQLYVEMLEAGFTSVGEFHYLHHDPKGQPYAQRAGFALRVVEAARSVGMGMTLLPVLYAARGFDAGAPEPAQRRFSNDLDGLMTIVEQARATGVRVGLAPHSLRAVPPGLLTEALSAMHALDGRAPIHIHVAEQSQEVEQCLAARGSRPIRWLLDNALVDERWCLVHATHAEDDEVRGIAASGAVVGLCPTTEANLGDGVVDALGMLGARAAFGIGSDSHVSVNVVEELRWLEYAQRLTHQRRTVLAEPGGSTAERLYAGALIGGSQALGMGSALAEGASADLVVLDPDHPALAERPLERVLDAYVLASNRPAVRDVMTAGRWVVRGGVHRDRERVFAAYRRALAAIV